MTLRVRLSIVPFGDETREEEIRQINISNLGGTGAGICSYGVEVDGYKRGEYDVLVTHKRSDGPLELVYKALGAYLDNKD